MTKTKFRIILLAAVLIVSLVLGVGIAALADSFGINNNQTEYASDRIIIKIKGDKEPFRVVQVSSGQVTEKVKEYQAQADVEYAEPDYKVFALGSNDTAYGNQWALNNTGQVIYKGSGNPDSPVDFTKPVGAGVADADVDWDEARSVFSATSVAQAVVAIVDSGIDETHPDLKNKIWLNADEIPGNRKDDDRNGFVDDTWGWDFVRRDNKPHDKYGHGTHVAGIAAAETNNGKGIAGVAFLNSVKIMPLQALNDQGIGFTSDIAKGIMYAADNG
ncbi:MAG: S8 family serine peptidase, partial [Patescibacteria group bacterium]